MSWHSSAVSPSFTWNWGPASKGGWIFTTQTPARGNWAWNGDRKGDDKAAMFRSGTHSNVAETYHSDINCRLKRGWLYKLYWGLNFVIAYIPRIGRWYHTLPYTLANKCELIECIYWNMILLGRAGCVCICTFLGWTMRSGPAWKSCHNSPCNMFLPCFRPSNCWLFHLDACTQYALSITSIGQNMRQLSEA